MLTVGILCGGKGTRIAAIAGHLPKALIPVAGVPFIDHQFAWLRARGVTRAVLLTGYRGDQIEAYAGSGAAFGLELAYSHDGDVLRGTAGAVAHALPLLGDPFVTLYGDALLPTDLGAIVRSLETGDDGVMSVYENRDRGIGSNVRVANGHVVAYDKQAAPGTMTHIDYGINVFHSRVFSNVFGDRPVDLAEVHGGMIARNALRAASVRERWYEIGSPEGLAETEHFVRSHAEFRGTS